MLTRLINATTVAREVRGGAQGLAYKVMTGEEPPVEHTWSTTTTLADYEDGNLVGRVGVRLAPAALIALLGVVALQVPLRAPQGIEWVGVGYLGVQAALIAVYDPLAGLYRVVRQHPDRTLQTVVATLIAVLAALVVAGLPAPTAEPATVTAPLSIHP